MTMAWVGIGSAVVGAAGQYMAADKAKQAARAAGAPQALPGPEQVGAYQSDQGGWWRDPITGQITQTNWNFDPSRMGSQLDAEMMWNSYMGRGNESQLGDLDWQIKSLTQNLERLKSQGGRAEKTIPSQFQGIQKFIDPQTGELAKWIGDPDGIQQGRYGAAGKEIYDTFMQETHGNYGRGFGNWLQDTVNRNVVPKIAEYKKFKETNLGNQDTSSRAMEDLQNQIQYLQQQRDRVANYKASENPLQKFSDNIGPRWQAKDNTNPWTDEWAQVVGDKIKGINDDPMDIMKKFGIGGEGDGYAGELKALIDKAGNIDTIDPNKLQAPELDASQAARLADSMNWQANQEFAGQRQQRQAEAAKRGMLNSAVGAAQDAAATGGLVGSQKDAALKAAMLKSDLVDKNFGQQAQAANFYSNAIDRNNQANLAARGFQLTGLGRLQDDAARNYGLWLQGNNQSFAQAQNALQTANQMRDTDRARDVQDYGFGRDENNTMYSRANDMWNRLNAMRQQGVTNNLNQSQALAGQANAAAQTNMGYVNMGNQQNMANIQMQNAYNQQQAQAEAARQAALWQGIGNIGAAGLNAVGQYYGNKTPPPAPGNVTNPGPVTGMPSDPNFGPSPNWNPDPSLFNAPSSAGFTGPNTTSMYQPKPPTTAPGPYPNPLVSAPTPSYNIYNPYGK